MNLPPDSYSIRAPQVGDGSVVLVGTKGVLRVVGFDPAFHLISGLVDLPFLAGWVVVVYQLRRIFRAMRAGEPFLVTNARRVRVIAWAVLGIEGARILVSATVLGPLLGRFETEGVALHVIAGPDLTTLFWAGVMFVIAEVFRRGARLQAEARLTV